MVRVILDQAGSHIVCVACRKRRTWHEAAVNDLRSALQRESILREALKKILEWARRTGSIKAEEIAKQGLGSAMERTQPAQVWTVEITVGSTQGG